METKRCNRRSIRLKGWDYSTRGPYFITLCVYKWFCLFGEIHDGKMQLNDAGRMVQSIWMDLPNRFPSVELGTMVIMPNHLHTIIALKSVEASTRGAPTVGDIMGAFKSITTVRYIAGVKQNRWPEFYRKLWERNYYEHIIRHSDAFHRIQRYIELNPSKWKRDRKNPLSTRRSS